MQRTAPGVLVLAFLLTAGHAAAAAAEPGHLWQVRYDVEFTTAESGRPAAVIEAALRWAGGPGESPETVEVDMAQDDFPGGYGSFVRGLGANPPGAGGSHRIPVQPDGTARFRYTVVLDHDATGWGPGPDEAPYVFDGGAFWTGRALFVTAPQSRVEVTFRAPAGERVTVSFDPIPGRPGSYGVPDETRLRDSFLMVGSQREARMTIGDAVVILALGGGLAGSMPVVEEAVRSFLETSGKIFGGAPPARVLVAGNLGAAKGSLFGGVFASDISILADRPLEKADAERWRPFLCHEIFHLWNGSAIDFDPGQQYWFSEGATEYYAHLLPVRLGQATGERFWETVKRKAAAWLAAAGSTSLLAAGDGKFLNHALVYDGGALAALAIDLRIREATANRRSLDDVARRLYRKARRGGTKVMGLADIVEAVSDAAGRPMDDFFARYIVGTEPLPLAETLALAGMRLETGIADLPERDAVLWTMLRLPSVSTEAGGLRVHESGSAEIRAGDLIVEVAGLPVRDFDDLRRAARDLRPAARASVAVLRDGRRLNLDAALGGNPDEPLPRSRQVTLTLDPDAHASPRAVAIRNALLGPGH